MDDRWQLFEYLKKSKGSFTHECIRKMGKMELYEGLIEFEYWCIREGRCVELEMMKKCIG